jgi:predicted ferric reductase
LSYKKIRKLKDGDELIIRDVWGAIEYKEGVFIAGGAGITPFIAILRQLQADDKIENNNKLIFTNEKDIILKKNLMKWVRIL